MADRTPIKSTPDLRIRAMELACELRRTDPGLDVVKKAGEIEAYLVGVTPALIALPTLSAALSKLTFVDVGFGVHYRKTVCDTFAQALLNQFDIKERL